MTLKDELEKLARATKLLGESPEKRKESQDPLMTTDIWTPPIKRES